LWQPLGKSSELEGRTGCSLEMTKGGPYDPFMLADDKVDSLNAVVGKLIGREHKPRTLFGQYTPIIDVSRANVHESKKEFMVELAAVEAVMASLKSIIDQIVPDDEKDTPERKAMLDRLSLAIEGKAVQHARQKSLNSAGDLALKNIFDTGFHYGTMRLIIAMYLIYREHLAELKDQEAQFWTVSSRPPNYYARTIALRLARLYSRENGKPPTFGMSREGNFPSTDFGRALEEVFRILEIKASVRNAATWAIAQLTDDDLRQPVNALAGLLGFPDRSLLPIANAMMGR